NRVFSGASVLALTGLVALTGCPKKLPDMDGGMDGGSATTTPDTMDAAPATTTATTTTTAKPGTAPPKAATDGGMMADGGAMMADGGAMVDQCCCVVAGSPNAMVGQIECVKTKKGTCGKKEQCDAAAVPD